MEGSGSLWNAFDAIKAVRYGTEWQTNVTKSEKEIFKDISNGTLPAMSWLIPDNTNSDHPGSGSDTGPSWVASVVNAVGESNYWSSTAVIVVWDDWGGFYDHVPPPFLDNWGGVGFRVPMLVVSAYAHKGTSSQGGYVSHTQYEFGSILRVRRRYFQSGAARYDRRARQQHRGLLRFFAAAAEVPKIAPKYSQELLRAPAAVVPTRRQRVDRAA